MSQVMKGFVGVFLLLLLTTSTVGLLGGFIQVLRAQSFHAGVLCELEDSDYAPEVIEECLEKAKENGYTLELTLYFKTGGNIKVETREQLPKTLSEVDMARAEMGFQIQVPILGISSQQILSGYGR